MGPMTLDQMNKLVATVRMDYETFSTPTLQFIVKATTRQIKVASDKRYSNQARIIREAVQQEIRFRNRLLAEELLLLQQWEVE
jgi:hypothetical protein